MLKRRSDHSATMARSRVQALSWTYHAKLCQIPAYAKTERVTQGIPPSIWHKKYAQLVVILENNDYIVCGKFFSDWELDFNGCGYFLTLAKQLFFDYVLHRCRALAISLLSAVNY
ncbi:hypothetical protein ACH5RR_033716 [Cinchona calisaya]|uniref:Reverse transcriptase n=1 Tax=Cinchona calisaya TaxID=153742 RepID=A0ABD2YDF9_9GENT